MFHVQLFEPHTGIVLEGFGALEVYLLLLSLLLLLVENTNGRNLPLTKRPSRPRNLISGGENNNEMKLSHTH